MKNKLPEDFKNLFWSYNFSKLDPAKHPKTVILNTINYGDLGHWHWLVDYYGLKEVKRVLRGIPQSGLRPQLRKLLTVMLGVNFKYAYRSPHKRR